jgi:hypothetical protein
MKLKNLMFGNGFFADQKMLLKYEKVASNSLMFVFYNSGLIGSFGFIMFFLICLKKINYVYFVRRKKNQGLYYECFFYLLIFMIFRGIFEDTLGFVSIDLLIFINAILYLEKKLVELKSTNSIN